MTKPFSLEELVARIRVILRRTGDAGADVEPAALRGPRARRGHARGHARAASAIDLTATEYRLLRYLMLNPRRVLTRAQILDHVWDYDFGGDARVLETYISYLRKKLDAARPAADPHGARRRVRAARAAGADACRCARAWSRRCWRWRRRRCSCCGAITYASQRSFQNERVDDQTRAAQPARRARARPTRAGALDVRPAAPTADDRRRPGPRANLPPGTYGQRRDAAGNVIGTSTLIYGQARALAARPARATSTPGQVIDRRRQGRQPALPRARSAAPRSDAA